MPWGVDLILNDQRRAFSDQYVNLILTVGKEYIEISSRNPIASLPSITPRELKNVPCILVASKEQRKNEREYYQGVVGFQGEFLYAENLDIPLFREGAQITRNYCVFWRKDNSGYYVEEFADMLKRKFE